MRHRQARALDVIGFGALNIDYIASVSKLSAKRTDPVSEWAARFEWNVETRVDEATIHHVISQLGVGSLSGSLGGSAWNAISGLAQMRVDLRLGYVGVVGRMDYPGLSFVRQMSAWGIDHRFLAHRNGGPCGLCLSYVEDDERVMLTYPGVNLEMSQHIRDNFEPLAAYLASGRFIHVTSFLDPDTPHEVLRVLSRAKQLNADMRISLDLGHDWSTRPTEPVRGLVRIADYLLLTHREFKALGQHEHGESDLDLAARILRQCRPDATVMVTKRYDTIEMFRQQSGRVSRQRFTEATNAAAEDIEDTTGAGDAFAAGLLAGLTSPRLQVELGACLGLSLARHTMRHRPFEGHAALPDLARGFLQSNEHPYRRHNRPGGVFVAHGEDPQWEIARRFLEDEGVHVYSLSPDARGEALADQLRDRLARCSFGVCVLSAHTSTHDGGRADQSLVHQAGILQGRYGFARVAMLVEEGCQMFSNVAGLIRFDFRTGHVESTFWDLARMLRREGLLPAA